MSKWYSDCISEFQIFANDNRKLICEFQTCPNDIQIFPVMNAITTIRSVHVVKHVFIVWCSSLTRGIILNWVRFHVHVIFVHMYLVWSIYTDCFVICAIMLCGPYTWILAADRERIVRVANNGGNWRQLVEQLGVKYNTAYSWIRASAKHPKPKVGQAKEVNWWPDRYCLAMIELDPAITLQQLCERTPAFGVHVSKSTIHSYLEGSLITLTKVHAIPAAMNTDANKELRRQYV